MIIFDLDGTLADCEHRRHFVDASYNTHTVLPGDAYRQYPRFYDQETDTCIIPCDNKWKPNWKAFYEECDKDTPIEATRHVLESLYYQENTIEIWSGRCESVRDKTEAWINKHLGGMKRIRRLVMRPKGDSTPDDVLKESWLDFFLEEKIEVHYVFDDRPKVVRMWRRKGIFVFDVNQLGKEF